jgi:prepilin-type N-terminal cleavage/methylation domain-containing protein
MRQAQRGPAERGFTLIELLVVLAIIGLLATTALASLVRARLLARETAAKQEAAALREAINILAQHVNKWPNGCPVEAVANPEVDLNNPQAGIAFVPAVGNQGGGCTWTAEDIAKWEGPYAVETEDPWGNPYYFDPDYVPYQNCGSEQTLNQQPVVHSSGPNESVLNAYDCDDIWLPLR